MPRSKPQIKPKPRTSTPSELSQVDVIDLLADTFGQVWVHAPADDVWIWVKSGERGGSQLPETLTAVKSRHRGGPGEPPQRAKWVTKICETKDTTKAAVREAREYGDRCEVWVGTVTWECVEND